MINTQDYLQRIHHPPVTQPDLLTLDKLQKAHLLAVPFENLDNHLGRPSLLNLDRIADKIIYEKRGGFCYELNGLFYLLLQALGFQVKMVSARVYNAAGEVGPEFDHLALIVNIEGKEYLSDVGFGEFSFYPMPIRFGQETDDPRGKFTMERLDSGAILVSKVEDKTDPEAPVNTPEYQFTEQARAFSEFMEMCRFHSLDPTSHFAKKPMVTLPNEHGRITIAGHKLKKTSWDNHLGLPTTTDQIIDNEQDYGKFYERYFGYSQGLGIEVFAL